MRDRKKRLLFFAGIVLAAYTVLVGALTYFESMSDAANITSFPKGLWYSLVVITTRRYSDLFPVTVYGRMIGMFFLFASIVFYCVLVAAVVSSFINLKRRWKPESR